jgi:hypothetical protein
MDKEWTITAEAGADLGALARRLTLAGFHVEAALDAIGVITGHGPQAKAAQWRKVSGVADVAATASFDVGPPDAPVS